METCIAVPIKTINTRLPGKTFRFLDGRPLYEYLFTTLKKLNGKEVKNVYIYSSDKKVLNISKKWGFIPLKQPKEYDTNPSVTGDFLIKQIIPNLFRYDIIGWFHITTPFLSENTIKRAISLIDEDKKVDSLFGVIPKYNRFWYQGKPVNHNPKNLIRTQDLSPIYEEADFYFFKRNSFEKYEKRVCGNFKTLEVNKIEGIDIDNLEDLIYAESLIKLGLVKF